MKPALERCSQSAFGSTQLPLLSRRPLLLPPRRMEPPMAWPAVVTSQSPGTLR